MASLRRLSLSESSSTSTGAGCPALLNGCIVSRIYTALLASYSVMPDWQTSKGERPCSHVIMWQPSVSAWDLFTAPINGFSTLLASGLQHHAQTVSQVLHHNFRYPLMAPTTALVHEKRAQSHAFRCCT